MTAENGAGGASRAGIAGVAGGMLPSGDCAERLANTSPVVPTVWLVLDGSGA